MWYLILTEIFTGNVYSSFEEREGRSASLVVACLSPTRIFSMMGCKNLQFSNLSLLT